MSKKVIEIYKDYPEQPFISEERDIDAWIASPESFPYQPVRKAMMERLPEGVLTGEIILLWRVHFNTFTTESIYPQYFEYKYGIDGPASLQLLQDVGYVVKNSAVDSLNQLTSPKLKEILKSEGLDVKGKKADLIERIALNIPEEKLEKLFTIRQYSITPIGEDVLNKYDDIVQKHGPKM